MTEPISTEPIIISIIAAIAIILVFGIPLYAVLKRNKITLEDDEPQSTTVDMEVTPVNDAGPKLAQDPVITSAPISAEPAAPKKRERKSTAVSKVAKTEKTPKAPKAPKTTKKTSAKNMPAKKKDEMILSKEFASKHGLKLPDTDAKPAKRTKKRK